MQRTVIICGPVCFCLFIVKCPWLCPCLKETNLQQLQLRPCLFLLNRCFSLISSEQVHVCRSLSEPLQVSGPLWIFFLYNLFYLTDSILYKYFLSVSCLLIISVFSSPVVVYSICIWTLLKLWQTFSLVKENPSLSFILILFSSHSLL